MPTSTRPDDWTSHYVHANGIRHHYLEWGDPDARPLLMLHATGLCAWPWKPIARRLARRYRVLAFDQRGHGDTDPSDKGYRFEYAGEDLAAIIDAMGLERPRVIGHSSGGLATIIAANLTPGRIGPVVLVETRVSNDEPTAPTQDLNRRAERTRMKRPIWDTRQAMFEAYRTRAAFKDWQDEPYQQFIEGGTRLLSDGRAELKCHPETEATFYGMRRRLAGSAIPRKPDRGLAPATGRLPRLPENRRPRHPTVPATRRRRGSQTHGQRQPLPPNGIP